MFENIREVSVPPAERRKNMIFYTESMNMDGEWDNYGIFVIGPDLVIVNDQTKKACSIRLDDLLRQMTKLRGV